MNLTKNRATLMAAFAINTIIGVLAYASIPKDVLENREPVITSEERDDIIVQSEEPTKDFFDEKYFVADVIENDETEYGLGYGTLPDISHLDEQFPVHQTHVDEQREINYDISEVNGDVICLAQNIFHEARGENIRGQEMVAMVTLNRVGKRHWADTVCGVVYQSYQFEWTINKPFMDLSDKGERDSFLIAIDIAARAINGDIEDFTKGANHYYNPNGVKGAQPTWPEKMQFVANIGNHKVYKD